MDKINVLLIDDEKSSFDIVRRYFKKNDKYEVNLKWLDKVTSDPSLLKLEEVDLILLDYHIHGATGLDMLAILDRENKTATNEMVTPVIMLSNTDDINVAAQSMLYGIANFIPKPALSAPLLNQTVNDIIERQRLKIQLEKKAFDIERQVQFDELTGAYNRFAFKDHIEKEISHSERHQHAFTLFYFDVNKFKEINDTHGHQAGDDVLITLIKILKQNLRKEDFLARLGENEFVLITPEVKSDDGIKSVLKKIHHACARPLANYTLPIHYSVSVGHACYPVDGSTSKELLDIADKRMYKVKKSRGQSRN